MFGGARPHYPATPQTTGRGGVVPLYLLIHTLDHLPRQLPLTSYHILTATP
nr:MAG TPA: hypothetical protein [Caudoviricetes sp.]